MTDAELIARLRSLKGLGWSNKAADRVEALEAESKLLRDAVYIDDLTVTMLANDRSKAAAGIERALGFLNADMPTEAKTALRTTLAEIKGEQDGV